MLPYYLKDLKAVGARTYVRASQISAVENWNAVQKAELPRLRGGSVGRPACRHGSCLLSISLWRPHIPSPWVRLDRQSESFSETEEAHWGKFLCQIPSCPEWGAVVGEIVHDPAAVTKSSGTSTLAAIFTRSHLAYWHLEKSNLRRALFHLSSRTFISAFLFTDESFQQLVQGVALCNKAVSIC